MTDKPIIFSAPMVQALLTGRKTQTRRLIRLGKGEWIENGEIWAHFDDGPDALPKPYRPGDRLYVREAWRPTYAAEGWRDDLGRVARPSDFDPKFTAIEYLADGTNELGGNDRPSIHMPRWASRLTLTVTEVRVQRLQEINEADAVAEGIEPLGAGGPNRFSVWLGNGWFNDPSAQECFSALWRHIHGPDAWDANPWVVAISFTVQHGNIDAVKPNA